MVLLLLVSILHWEMAYSVRIVLRKYKPNSMGYHILQLCVTKNSCRKRISLKLYVDMVYLTTDHIQRQFAGLAKTGIVDDLQKGKNRFDAAVNFNLGQRANVVYLIRRAVLMNIGQVFVKRIYRQVFQCQHQLLSKKPV